MSRKEKHKRGVIILDLYISTRIVIMNGIDDLITNVPVALKNDFTHTDSFDGFLLQSGRCAQLPRITSEKMQVAIDNLIKTDVRDATSVDLDLWR